MRRFEKRKGGYHGDTGKLSRIRHQWGPAQRAAGKDLRCTGDLILTVDTQTQKTGVTVVMPCADDMFAQKLPAAACVLNGFGKTAGLVQIGELGTLETPIALTNTLNVGLVYDAMVEYMVGRCAQRHGAAQCEPCGGRAQRRWAERHCPPRGAAGTCVCGH